MANEEIIEARVKNRIGTESEWLAKDPVILKGEISLTKRNNLITIKVGDGVKKYSEITDNVVVSADGAFMGSAIPSDTPVTPLGPAYWIATQAGVYDGFGGVVVDPNSIAVISYNGEEYTISQTEIDLAEYQKKDFSPYNQDPITTIARQASEVVKELYIVEYDPLFNYYLTNVSCRWDGTSVGYTDNIFRVSVVKEEIANTANKIYYTIEISDNRALFDIPTFLRNADFMVNVDWFKMPEGDRLSDDPAPKYLLNKKIASLDNNPTIKTFLINYFELGNENQFIMGAGNKNVTGENNIGIGIEALRDVGAGGGNVAIGRRALRNAVSGGGNVAVGFQAMVNGAEVTDCTAVGSDAFKSLINGVGGSAFGRKCLEFVKTAGANTAYGDSALMSLLHDNEVSSTDGYGNVAVGYGAAVQMLNARECVFVGLTAARFVESAIASVIVGAHALYQRTGNSTNNTVLGFYAMQNSLSGNDNTVVGAYAMGDNNGARNVVIGNNAAASLTSGNNNVVIGDNAGNDISSYSDCVVLGKGAKPTGNNQVVIGTSTMEKFNIGGVEFTKAQLEALLALVS